MGEKLAVVTGASSGFGLLTSIELAKKDFTVIATMRNTTKDTDLMNLAKESDVASRIIVHELDITNDLSIRRLQESVMKKGTINVLVNNAGYAGAGFTEEITLNEYKQQFETNFFGAVAVTKSFLPLMRKQGYGKIINISSISGEIGFPGLSPYVASKHALEGWSESLRLEMKPYGVDIILIEPGSYKTNIWSTGKQVAEASLKIDSPYQSYMKRIESYIQSGESRYGDPLEVANKIAEISLSSRPKFRYPLGKGVRGGILVKNLLPWNTWERFVLKKLFSKNKMD
nr:oxidoreductase [Neobacillus sp. Marseille-Q6967]